MNNNLRIVFPKGGGGSWLSSLIWNLTIGNWAIPNIDVNFDSEPRGSIWRDHYPLHQAFSTNLTILFSTKRFFNLHLNDSIEQIKPKFYHLQLDALEFVRPYTFIWKQ